MVEVEGFKPTLYGLEDHCFILLSYTSTQSIFKRLKMVGETGLEPAKHPPEPKSGTLPTELLSEIW